MLTAQKRFIDDRAGGTLAARHGAWREDWLYHSAPRLLDVLIAASRQYGLGSPHQLIGLRQCESQLSAHALRFFELLVS